MIESPPQITPVHPSPEKHAPRTAGDLSLALQGGGAFGAFTWGVLDRLLEEDGISFDAISGASAGAVNGVLLAEGLRTGGAAGARALLDRFWTRLASDAAGSFLTRGARVGLAFDLSTRVMSPYQFNPFDLNPLRAALSELIDFAALREAAPVRLIVSATRVADGATRLFDERQITRDAVLASACLPLLHQAVDIDGDSYWDGGYGANPPLLPLVEATRARRILLVRIVPTSGDEHPTSSPNIVRRLSQITFNATLQHDLDAVAAMRRLAEGDDGRGPDSNRLLALSVDQLSAEDWYPNLATRSAGDLGRGFLTGLRDAGRRAAQGWLAGGENAASGEAAG